MTATLAEPYVPLARKLAWQAVRRYRRDYDETYSDALYGLAKALSRRRRGLPCYVTQVIKWEILRGIRDRSGLRATLERGSAPPPQAVSINEVPLPATDDPVRDAERAELWATVDRLPPRERLAVRLYYQWEFSQDEIAPVLGISQMQVSRDLAHACATLAVALAA